MEKDKISILARKLYNAERRKEAIPPLTEEEDVTVDDAYAIQLENVERVVKMGYTVSGKKIGLTSEGIQKQLGVNEPDYGHLFSAMDCKDGTVHTEELLQPKIEAELAFILKSDLAGGHVTVEDVRDATEYVTGAFEIVDSRVADWKIRLPDTVADNASSGRYVLGTVRHRIQDVNLQEEKMRLFKNGEKIAEGKGSAVLGDPCIAVAWLANRLWDYGVTLKKGEIILSGAFSAAPAAEKGDVFEVLFSSFGTVKASFI